MASPGDFLNKYRYAALAALLVLTIGYGWYLYRLYVPAQPAEPYSVPVAVMVDGTVRIDGTQYTGPETLKLKVAEIQKEHPDAGFSIRAPHGDELVPIAKAVSLLQKSGARTIWVLNEPQKAQEGR